MRKSRFSEAQIAEILKEGESGVPIANHRKVKKLLRAWEAQRQRLIDLNAPE